MFSCNSSNETAIGSGNSVSSWCVGEGSQNNFNRDDYKSPSPLISQKTLRRDLQAALNHSVLVASNSQRLAVAARSVLELDYKLTIFALSLDQSVWEGVSFIVSDKLHSGPHGLAGD